MPPSPTSSQKGMELCRSVLSPGSMLAMGCSLPSCVPSFEGAATWRDYCTACERETRVRMVTSEIVRVGQHVMLCYVMLIFTTKGAHAVVSPPPSLLCF